MSVVFLFVTYGNSVMLVNMILCNHLFLLFPSLFFEMFYVDLYSCQSISVGVVSSAFTFILHESMIHIQQAGANFCAKLGATPLVTK